MKSLMLTPEASAAFSWMLDNMPDRLFNVFALELEASLRNTALRFGLNEELLRTFNVNALVARRDDLTLDDAHQTLEANIYAGSKRYAVLSSGRVYCQCQRGSWRPSLLTPDDVKKQSVTCECLRIKIKQKYL
ncbi:hypothetical protein ACMYSP_01200 [Klebsiella sp. R390]|uniref:hypothetical protein n=1 Tax=Klebsiella sp. R390 TaxID=2755400 RepID=UPI003DA8237A